MTKADTENWKLEDDVNDYVKNVFASLKLEKLADYNVESGMSEYMKEALKVRQKRKIRAILASLIFILKNTSAKTALFRLCSRIN